MYFMKNLVIFFLIISPLNLFCQQFAEITLENGSFYRGEILEYDDDEFKLVVKKRKIITIAKSDITSPKMLLINPKNFKTIISVGDDNWYKGEVVIENDTTVMIELGKNLFKTIHKSDIIFRKNRAKKNRYFIRTTLYTKDGNKLIGEIIDNNEYFTVIDVGDKKLPLKVRNENIKYKTEVFEKNDLTSFQKVLIGIGVLYVLPGLLTI